MSASGTLRSRKNNELRLTPGDLCHASLLWKNKGREYSVLRVIVDYTNHMACGHSLFITIVPRIDTHCSPYHVPEKSSVYAIQTQIEYYVLAYHPFPSDIR